MRVVCKDSNHILNSLTINNTYDVISYWSSTNGMLKTKPPDDGYSKIQYRIIDDSGNANYYDSSKFIPLRDYNLDKITKYYS